MSFRGIRDAATNAMMAYASHDIAKLARCCAVEMEDDESELLSESAFCPSQVVAATGPIAGGAGGVVGGAGGVASVAGSALTIVATSDAQQAGRIDRIRSLHGRFIEVRPMHAQLHAWHAKGRHEHETALWHLQAAAAILLLSQRVHVAMAIDNINSEFVGAVPCLPTRCAIAPTIFL
jgi:hypothetical protein